MKNLPLRVFLIIEVILELIVIVEGCRSGELLANGINANERYQILKIHNELRQQVAMGQINGQPGASNMQEMQWDANLAHRAQEWANQCVYDHDSNRFDDRFSIGQNLAIIWSSQPLEIGDDFEGRINKWFNEVAIYRWGQGWNLRTGHYSQMIWAGTNLVGCGFSYYRQSGQYKKLYVCNYGPAGNVAGRLPYQPGYPQCTGYGMDNSQSYPGLCLSDEYDNSISGVNNPRVYNPYHPNYSRPQLSNRNYYSNINLLDLPKTTGNAKKGYYESPKRVDPAPDVKVLSYLAAPSSNNDRPINKFTTALNSYRWDLLFKNFIRDIV